MCIPFFMLRGLTFDDAFANGICALPPNEHFFTVNGILDEGWPYYVLPPHSCPSLGIPMSKQNRIANSVGNRSLSERGELQCCGQDPASHRVHGVPDGGVHTENAPFL